MPEASHPLWRIISMCVVGIIVCVMLKYNYASGWVPKDFFTLIAILLGQGITDTVAGVFGRKDSR